VAALLVLVFHAIASTEVVNRYLGTDARSVPIADNAAELVVANGFTGVALFFVISGFIFTWGALQASRFEWKSFLLNRVLRIYPLYLLAVFATVTLAYGQVNLLQVFQYVIGFGNLSPSIGQFDVVLWTISVELQFYLLFPFLLLLLKRQGVRYLLGLIAIVIGLRLVARLSLHDIHNAVYWTMFGRLDQFLIGMVMAWWVHQRGWLSAAGRRLGSLSTVHLIAGLICSSSILLALLRFYTEQGWKWGNSPILVAWPTVEATMWAAIGLFYVALARRIPARILWPLQFAGMVSYSLYLLHYPIIKALFRQDLLINIPGHAFASGLLTTAIIVIPVSLAAAALTFYVIEKPPLSLRRTYAPVKTREERLATLYGLHMEPDRPGASTP
jgi:peptidoglycan/LPS O-acetylase OafA/YrhL